jgi:hypothetical protein
MKLPADVKQERRQKVWRFSDLFTDSTTGRMSESLMWSNIGKAAMTWGFCYICVTQQTSEFLWLAYGGAVLGHNIAARVLNQRQQQIEKQS